MLKVLNEEILPQLPSLLEKPSIWQTLVINRRKPHTYRAFTQLGDLRICLHVFEECDPEEAFLHPHPWPAAFKILRGAYQMQIACSLNRTDLPEAIGPLLQLNAGSSYEITNPLIWHSVAPIVGGGNVCTIMINGPAWNLEEAHTAVRRTAGKDLQEMSADELNGFLYRFKRILRGLNLDDVD